MKIQGNVNSGSMKSLPYDEYAERAVLGAMLINNNYANEVFSEIAPSDFHRNSNHVVAAAINKLINDGTTADIVTISGHLDRQNDLKIAGGHEYITSLLDGIPDNIDITEYIKTILELSSLRQIILASANVMKKGTEEGADSKSILVDLQEDLIKISNYQDKEGFHSTEEIVPIAIDQIENIQKHGNSNGITTGFTEIDKMTGGFQKGDLIVIAARPSMGKTALALNIVANMAIKNEKSVGFFSIEMNEMQVMMRLLALRANINLSQLIQGKKKLTGPEWQQLNLAASEFRKSDTHIDDSAVLSIIEMKTRARRLQREGNLDIIFVDYLQLMKVSGDNMRRSDSRAQEVAIISSSLKAMAKELNIPVVALAQLNRSPEQRGGASEGAPKYQLSDLKESGAIEQDADIIMFLHREEQYNKDTDRTGEADVIIAKQRNGPTGNIKLAYISEFTKFANLEYSDYSDDEF